MMYVKRLGTTLRFVLLLLGAFALGGQHARADSCEVRIGQSEVDFGQIRNLGAGGRDQYPIGTRHVSLNATCPSNTKILMVIRGDSLAEHFRFAARGQMRVGLSNVLLDGRAVDLALIKAVGEAPGLPASAISVSPGDLVVPVSGGLAAEGSLLSMQIEVSPSVAMDELNVRDVTTLESSLSFEVRGY